jgi:hypothetical protein
MHMYKVAIHHLEWIDVDEEVLQIRPMIATIFPRWAPTVGYIREVRDPSQNRRSLGHSTPKAIQTTIQDVGCYASCGPNLSKLCVPCTFEFLISAFLHPKFTTLGISHGGQPVKHRQLAR